MIPEFGRTQYLSSIRHGPWHKGEGRGGEGERGIVVLFRRSCFDLRHKMSASKQRQECEGAARTLNATGALFGFSSFRISVTSRLKGPITGVASGQ
jgi:hypothetical protein